MSAESYPTPGGYYSPNRNLLTRPSFSTAQTPVLRYDIDSGEFKLTLFSPQWVEAGNSARFSCYFEHKVDGPIPFTNPPNNTAFVFPSLLIKDGNGNTVATGVTINAIASDPGLEGNFYCQVEMAATLAPGDYEVEWDAEYQPQPVNGVTQPELPIRARRNFKILATQKPSQFFLVSTKHI
jgi:hypothetical protein